MFSTVLLPLSEIGGGIYLGWGRFLIQFGNLIVIVVMLALFALALVLPFPGTKRPK